MTKMTQVAGNVATTERLHYAGKWWVPAESVLPPQEMPDEKIRRLVREAYRKFASEPLVKLWGGVDRASYCAGFDEGYHAALQKRAAE